jgi:hypothetical protein
MRKTTIDDVSAFLSDFFTKFDIYDIIFERRDKNDQALLDLEITPSQRKEIIKKLVPVDYLSGPNPDENDTSRPDYWEFGIKVRNVFVYIKINIGKKSKPVICISFHIAEYKMKFPFRKG